jgi:hypothetical protein
VPEVAVGFAPVAGEEAGGEVAGDVGEDVSGVVGVPLPGVVGVPLPVVVGVPLPVVVGVPLPGVVGVSVPGVVGVPVPGVVGVPVLGVPVPGVPLPSTESAAAMAAGDEEAPLVPAGSASCASSCGEWGRAVTAARAAAWAWIAGLAPGTAPSAGSAPAGSGPGSPWPAERASGAIAMVPESAACWPAGAVSPAAAPASSALPAPRGTLAVAAGPASDGMAAGDTTESDGEMARITATDPPAAASASADAASARLDLISTGERLGLAECRLSGFAFD